MGAPRCPVVTALSVAQAVALSENAWGPRVLLAAAGRVWRAVCRVDDWNQWGATFVGRDDAGRGLASDVARRRRGVLYTAFWLVKHGGECG
eukprot:1367578-Alexandrium_andersonii.AAC.1